MTFKLEIELGNDAMQTFGDVLEAFDRSVHSFVIPRYGTTAVIDGDQEFNFVKDTNGNLVGKWSVEK